MLKPHDAAAPTDATDTSRPASAAGADGARPSDADAPPGAPASTAGRRGFLRTLLGTALAGPVAGALGGTRVASAATKKGAADTATTAAATDDPRAADGRTLFALADAYVRRDARNTNEGGNIRLRVGVKPISRALVQFDPVEVYRLFDADVARVYLVLTIAVNHDEWGQLDDRTVDAHPLLEEFVEGNGAQGVLPGRLQRRGNGAGATWSSPGDPDVDDNAPGRRQRKWDGGNFGAATAPGVVHINQQYGDVAWDVTADVLAGRTGWVVKATDEKGPAPRIATLPDGFESSFGGTVEYFSREGAKAAGLPNAAPRLVYVSAPPAPSASEKPLPSQSAQPLPSQSAQPLPSQSAQPLPSQSAQPLPSQSAQPLPSQSAQPLPSQSAQPLPSASMIIAPSLPPAPSASAIIAPSLPPAPSASAIIAPSQVPQPSLPAPTIAPEDPGAATPN